MNQYSFGKLYKRFLFILWQTTFSEGVETKPTNPHNFISGQTHIIQKRDQISMDPLDQALHMEFLEKWVCMILKFLTTSEAEPFFLLGWSNTGMNLIIKGLFKWLENQMMIEFGSLDFLSHLNIDQKNQIQKNQILMVF